MMKLWTWITAALLLVCTIRVESQTLAPAPVSVSPPPPPPSVNVPSSPCFSTMYNPCGLGTCINTGSSSYRCVCPKGTAPGQRLSGKAYCQPYTGYGYNYTTVSGDTCYIIAIVFRLTIAQLQTLNPALDCSNVAAGLLLDVTSPRETSSSTCWIRYTFAPIDTCTSIRSRFGLPSGTLLTINPALDCSVLLASNQFLSVCIREWKERAKFYICSQYKAPSVYFSKNCRLVAGSARRTALYNPGLYCMRLNRSPQLFCSKATPYTSLSCRSTYFVTSSDTCDTLYSLFGSSSTSLSTKIDMFKDNNNNMVCDSRFLFVGQKICLS